MRGAVLYGPRDVRFEEGDAPKIMKRPMPSLGPGPHVCAGPICGPIAVSTQSPTDADGT
jgi:hypothetical protein